MTITSLFYSFNKDFKEIQGVDISTKSANIVRPTIVQTKVMTMIAKKRSNNCQQSQKPGKIKQKHFNYEKN